MQTQKHLTTEELAARWRIHPMTLCQWRTKGTGPKFLKIGRNVLYSEKEVEAFEQQQQKRSTAG